MRKRRKRLNWPLIGAILVFLSLTLFLPLALALIEARNVLLELPPGFRDSDLMVRVKIHEYLPPAITLGWFFIFGASFGSFVNVVAYRMPAGISIWRGGSRCPRCLVDIRPTDNIPVFGWIGLRGRCRACHLPISARYPIVESAYGLLFVIIAWRELFSGGVNLPFREPDLLTGAANTLLSPNVELLVASSFHAMLFSILLCFSLIRFDRKTIPLRLTAFSYFSVGAFFMLSSIWNVVPSVWFWGDQQTFEISAPQNREQMVLAIAAEIAIGFLISIAVAIAYYVRQRDNQDGWRNVIDLSLVLGLLALSFGNPTLISILLLATILNMIGTKLAPTFPFIGFVTLSSLIHWFAWSSLTESTLLPASGEQIPMAVGFAAALTMAATAGVLKRFANPGCSP